MYQSCLINIGYAAPLSIGMTYVSMADSISHLMNNAVSAQGNSQVIQNSSVTQTCALIIATGAAEIIAK